MARNRSFVRSASVTSLLSGTRYRSASRRVGWVRMIVVGVVHGGAPERAAAGGPMPLEQVAASADRALPDPPLAAKAGCD